MRSATAAAYKQAIGVALAVILVLAGAASARAASTFYIRGGGDGHGIGMSQYGAYGYALHGKSYRWILAHYYRGTAIGQASPGRIVRVLLPSGTGTFTGASRAGSTKLDPAKTYAVRPNADGTLTLKTAAGRKVASSAAPLRVTGPGPLKLVGVGLYRGSLEFRAGGSGGLETVDAVRLADYVRGVIAAETPSSWSQAALEAQAVAARTYAITSDVGGGTFDLYADTRSQMYGGVYAETRSTDAAVAATRGQVVTYHGRPVVTYFFSSSGGHTENIENVWPGARPEPWLRGVRDPYDGAGGDPYHRWTYHLTVAAAAARLGKWVKGGLVGIRITKHGSSPRILSAVIVGTKGSTTVTGIQLQHAFGLLTTYAAFTTIVTAPGRAASGAARSGSEPSGGPQSQAVSALGPLVHALIGATAGLHGTVFPPRKGQRVAIQRATRRGWRTVLHTRLGAGGGYHTALPGPGRYRIMVGGLAGPAVTVS